MSTSAHLELPDLERGRLMAFSKAILPSLRVHMAVLAGVVALSSLTLPPEAIALWALALVAACALVFAVHAFAARAARPVIGYLVQDLSICALFAVGLATTGGLAGFAAPLMFHNVLMGPARFSGPLLRRVLVVKVSLVLAGALAADPELLLHNPALLLSWAGAMATSAALVVALTGAERDALYEARKDSLTGLLNRAAFEQRMADLERQTATTGAPTSLLLCDLDGFKTVNDTRGHAAGDLVLQRVAGVLRDALENHDLIYRLGGDEFVILLPGSGEKRAAEIAERIRDTIARGLARDDVTVSIGSSSRTDGIDGLLRDADLALYSAKAAGRNQVGRFNALRLDVCAPQHEAA